MLTTWEHLTNKFARIFNSSIEIKDRKNIRGFTLKNTTGNRKDYDWTGDLTNTHEVKTIKAWLDILNSRLKSVTEKARTNVDSFKIIVGIILLMIFSILSIVGFTSTKIKDLKLKINISAGVQSFVSLIFAVIWLIYYLYSKEMPFGFWGIVIAHLLFGALAIWTLTLIPDNTRSHNKRTSLTFILYSASLIPILMFFGILLGSFIHTKKLIYFVK